MTVKIDKLPQFFGENLGGYDLLLAMSISTNILANWVDIVDENYMVAVCLEDQL